MKISTGKIKRPQRTVIYGPEGIGKTTLASQFPDPLFIDTEGGTAHIDVKRVDPAPSSWSMLKSYVREVIADPSVCQTLVIDTADWAERLCIAHVLDDKDKDSIEDFGWGKGYTLVKEEFGRLLDLLTDVMEHGVNVVVTAHAQIKKFEQPDELGTYDRWELKLSKFDAPLLKEWADMVLFLNYKTIVVQPDQKTGGKAKAAGGKRIMYTTHTPAFDAKNRCGLADELPMEFASIAACIPQIARIQGEIPVPAEDEKPADNMDELMERNRKADEKLAEVRAELESKTEQESEPEPEPEPDPLKLAPSSSVEKLRELMKQAGITEKDIVAYSEQKKYCPPGTPFEVYPESYYKHLITHWDEVLPEIEIPF